MYQQSQQIKSQEGNDPQFAKVIEAYDSKQRQEQERAMNREAKLELNQDLKEFEQAKSSQTILHKVHLDFEDCSNDNEPFSDFVSRQINHQDNTPEFKNLDRLRVVSKMGSIAGSDSKSSNDTRKDEPIEMKTQAMRDYVQYKRQKAAQKQPQAIQSAIKDGQVEADINIQMDEKVLMRMFQKDDFKNLKVAGQFNKGFIMATLNENDLFILDQHACDEKFNFENFSKTTVIEA